MVFLRRSFLPFFVAVASGVACLAPARAQSVLDGIAAEVGMGGEKAVVTFSQLRELVGPREQQAKQTLQGEAMIEKIKEIRVAAINDLIDRTLILQEYKLKGYILPEYLIDERINDIIRDTFGGDRRKFLLSLTAQGLTIDKFRGFQRDSYIVQQMRHQVSKGAITVSDQRVQNYYKEHAGEYSTPEEVHLRMIVIRGGSGAENRRKLLEEIRAKIVDGAAFGNLARMYDEGGSQDTYGDLGWIDRNHFNESLTRAAFALNPGEMSQIIELGGSYYLLLSEAKKQAGLKSLKEMRPQIEKVLLQSEHEKEQQDWLLKLRKKAYIKVY